MIAKGMAPAAPEVMLRASGDKGVLCETDTGTWRDLEKQIPGGKQRQRWRQRNPDTATGERPEKRHRDAARKAMGREQVCGEDTGRCRDGGRGGGEKGGRDHR